MSKVLYVNANPKPAEASYSLQVSDAFVQAYQQLHPEDEIITLNLYEQTLPFIHLQDLEVLFAPDKSALKDTSLLEYVHQFIQADKYIFSYPMWNLGVPAILKAYIDLISVVGLTFKYTAQGPVGLLENKKAMLVNARGGDYSSPAGNSVEFCTNYMKAILGLFGVQDITALPIDCTNIQGLDIAAMLSAAKENAVAQAAKF